MFIMIGRVRDVMCIMLIFGTTQYLCSFESALSSMIPAALSCSYFAGHNENCGGIQEQILELLPT